MGIHLVVLCNQTRQEKVKGKITLPLRMQTIVSARHYLPFFSVPVVASFNEYEPFALSLEPSLI